MGTTQLRTKRKKGDRPRLFQVARLYRVMCIYVYILALAALLPVEVELNIHSHLQILSSPPEHRHGDDAHE